MLFEPPPSQGDLHFRLFGFPVRVHPMFWLATVLLGIHGGEGGTPPAELVIWVVVVFASILVHELGHAVVQRRFGGHPWITLHAFGGLASCNDCDRRPRSQILISLAGPAAGFLLATVVFLALRLTGHEVGVRWGNRVANLSGVIGMHLPLATIYWEPLSTMNANLIVLQLFWINILWGLVNLLPIYPLDGGRVVARGPHVAQSTTGNRLVAQAFDGRRGAVGCVWVSRVGIVVYGAVLRISRLLQLPFARLVSGHVVTRP